jgi:hypothetical protein
VCAAALLAGASLGCVHLLQPQTYYLDTARVRLQREEYVDKELVAGLPEDLFLAWYTRSDSWSDTHRPYILESDEEDGARVYALGTGGRIIARAFFRDGLLAEIGAWGFDDTGLFFHHWAYGQVRPRRSFGEIGAWLADLDPPAEVLAPDRAAGRTCDFAPGDEVENVGPLRVIRGPGRRRVLEGADAPIGTGRHDAVVLPAGTVFRVERWNVFRTRLRGPDGTRYAIDGVTRGRRLCPAGDCARVGEEGILTREVRLVEWQGQSHGRPVVGVVPGETRIPVWARRLGTLPPGTRVRVVSWDPCGSRQAIVEVADRPDPSPGRPGIFVKIAPEGLFRPLRQEPGSSGSGGF